jgi:Tfp pilus assembly protein PilO
VTLTDRDRKILLALVPLALALVYWFLILAPKRQEATQVHTALTQAQSERDTAVQRLAGLGAAKRSFGKDFATVIYLGKAIPTDVDTPSLMVQLDRAARGTGIRFSSIKTGPRATGTTSAAGTTGTSSPTSTTTSTPASGSAPAGASTQASASSAATLDNVPVDFQFSGSYFDLAGFFHRMKRFVRVVNDRIVVRGRLMTINTFSFQVPDSGTGVEATMHGTVYLAPKGQGTSAGATQSGPAGASPSAAPATQSASTSSTPPAATVTAR